MRSGVTKTDLRLEKIEVTGIVQGVGFRPFVYNLARAHRLSGYVMNNTSGVVIEAEGNPDNIEAFMIELEHEAPVLACIERIKRKVLNVGQTGRNYDGFEIHLSEHEGRPTTSISPDVCVCESCLTELFDARDRRFLYPFTNCTNCGPRYSIIESLPYDRHNTTMKIFTMCEECQEEYHDPSNRRFHAQPNACPECGPQLELWNIKGEVLSSHFEASLKACDSIRNGDILALKGLGGFQLLVDARNEKAIARLRRRKVRHEKPYALMYPDPSLVGADCEVSDLEERLLSSSESPIVLLRKKTGRDRAATGVSFSVAPDNPYLGIMLPYTPLHHLLMVELGFPVVATSGNLSDEPICIDEYEGLARLREIADLFLVHNRPIARHVDDSVAQVVNGRMQILRCARGYAPMPVELSQPVEPCLAVGAHLKNSIAISTGNVVFISQHVGDLETRQAYRALEQVTASLSEIYDFTPRKVACDLHPDYLSTKFAAKQNSTIIKVQHHYAHILSCMAENKLQGPVLGVAWDGTGLGLDGTIWGGEFLQVDEESFTRVAHLRIFRLPGSEKAVSEPRRSAAGLLYEIFEDKLFSMQKIKPLAAFDSKEKSVLHKMLAQKINTPATSSAGRLFDAVASILGLCQISSHEGQAAIKLEFAALSKGSDESYRFGIARQRDSLVVDWEPMIRDVLNDLEKLIPPNLIAAKFHNTLADMIVRVAGQCQERNVVLTGGCFQNKYLTERTVCRLESVGFKPFIHERIPPNDGGIALGQIMAVSRLKLKDQ